MDWLIRFEEGGVVHLRGGGNGCFVLNGIDRQKQDILFLVGDDIHIGAHSGHQFGWRADDFNHDLECDDIVAFLAARGNLRHAPLVSFFRIGVNLDFGFLVQTKAFHIDLVDVGLDDHL